VEEAKGPFYDETADAPTKTGQIIGSIFSMGVYAMMAWLMVYPLMH
jgi:hypothetical protein